MALVSYALAKNHLRLPDDESKATVNLLSEQATQVVLKYIGRDPADSPAWDDSTDPTEDDEFAIVQGAVLKVLAYLWRWRGDDDKEPPADGPLTKDVRQMLLLVKDYSLG